MKMDITGRPDIELLINSFYEKVKRDEQIGFFFSDVIPVNWEDHLPVMYNFWEGIIFGTGNYQGNTMQKHLDLHQKSNLQGVHFDRWYQIFSETVDDIFIGPNATLTKQRALSIATVIQIKIANAATKAG